MARLSHTFLLLFVLATFVGCGSDSAPETVDNSDLQSYLKENPEMGVGDEDEGAEGDDFDASE